MSRYYDTGVLIKLYTAEPESAAVQRFVMRKAEPLHLHSLHRTELVSALRLKLFRKECTIESVNAALADIESDFASGVLQRAVVDWDQAWVDCRELSDTYSAATGCRTLDALHVACARNLQHREFVTTDKRQATLAKRVGLRVINPK